VRVRVRVMMIGALTMSEKRRTRVTTVKIVAMKKEGVRDCS
jgi:hypothetical protein